MNHLSVKLPKLVKHCLILYVGEVSPGSREEYVVFLLNMFRVELNERFKARHYFIERCLVTFPVTYVSFYQGFCCAAAKDVVFNQFIH